MAHHKVPAVSMAVLKDGDVLWARAWGTADLEAGASATTNTLFQAASMSKPVAALTALTLVDEGVLDLDAPVNKYLKEWRVPESRFTKDHAVTLRGLMTHSAGTTVWGFEGYRKDQPFAPDQPIATNVQVLNGDGNSARVRVFKVPDTSMRYSGGGYTVLEQLVEEATGLAFETAAHTRLLEPAGLALSTYAQPLPKARWAEAARGHRGDGSEVEGEWHSYPEQAAAGLWSTPTDLAKLSIHLLQILDGETDGILSKALLEEAMTPHHPGDPAFQNWGLGFSLKGSGETVRFSHGGANEGYRCQWLVYRGTGNGAIVMTNGDGGGPLIDEIFRALAASHGWPDFEPEARAARMMDKAALEAYAGAYEVEGITGPDGQPYVIVVQVGEGTLEVDVPEQGRATLHPDSEGVDRFFDASDGTNVQFERNKDGRVVAAQEEHGAHLIRRE